MYATLLLSIAPAVDLPVFGQPVPELQAFDEAMQDFMELQGISAGVLGVMRSGTIVYQRGFGVPENTPMRIASVEKPITAAAVRILASQGALNLTDPAFNLNGNGGILNIAPWQGAIGDDGLDDITVQDLIDHYGGWNNNDSGFPQFETESIGTIMGLGQPANREQVVSYMLTQPLQNPPGSMYAYSNFGFMVLGLIIEERSGINLQDYVRANVLTPQLWVPATEIYRGQTHLGDVSPREPFYVSSIGLCTDIFQPSQSVWCPYGSWSHHEAFQGHGNLVASAAPLLEYLDRWIVWGLQASNGPLGAPHGGTPPFAAGHTGSIDGTSTIASQGSGSNPVHIVVLFNERNGDFAALAAAEIRNIIAAGVTWPTASVDGFWVDFGAGSSGNGGFSDPFASMGAALGATVDGTKLRFQPGSSSGWSGTIDERMLLDAPLGAAVVGL